MSNYSADFLAKKLRSGASFAALSLSLVFAGGMTAASAETLQDALVATYGSNPTLQAARAELRATDENVNQALANWRPSISATGTSQFTQSDSDLRSGAGLTSLTAKDDRTTNTGTVTVQQNIFRGGRTVSQTRQAKAQVAAGRAQLTSTEQDVLLSAVTAYMDVLRDTATVELNQNNVAVLQRQLEASQDRFDVGEITRTDVAQSEARLSRSESSLIQAQANLINSRATYERVVGSAPGTLQAAPVLPPLPESEDAALATATVNNPTLVAARFAEEASRHAIRTAQGGLLPTLTVQGDYSQSDNPSSTVKSSETASVTGRLTIPLYQSGAEYSQIRQAKQLNSQSRLQIREATRSVEEGVASAWENYRAANARIVSDREQVRANEIALDGVQQEAQVGSRTTLDVLDAEQELLDSRVALVTSERNAYVAAYQVLSAIGRLNAGYLALPVDQYDPGQNYDDVSGQWIGWGIDDEPDDVAPESGTDAASQL
ncbi:TolC family outer membrane protein [Pyruvatibacter sp.]|uniref:TolC family outer membrane protein n=1 Tax=Pyruvatibacter sp. TaxID=1981328 RepID=UPI003264C5C8